MPIRVKKNKQIIKTVSFERLLPVILHATLEMEGDAETQLLRKTT